MGIEIKPETKSGIDYVVELVPDSSGDSYPVIEIEAEKIFTAFLTNSTLKEFMLRGEKYQTLRLGAGDLQIDTPISHKTVQISYDTKGLTLLVRFKSFT